MEKYLNNLRFSYLNAGFAKSISLILIPEASFIFL